MIRALTVGLTVLLAAAAGPAFAGPRQEMAGPLKTIQPVSWGAWLSAKAKAEENDAAGNLVTALQYYLEYTRQAQGLNNPARVAWGKNNAAYMIIKMHRLDPTVDLAPAERLLKEGLAVEGATEDCRKVLAMNLDYLRQLSAGTAR